MRAFDAGETVIEEGMKDGRLYVLKRGMASVSKRGVELNRIASPGSVFGEISLLLDRAHGASVTACEASEFFIIEEGESFVLSRADLTIQLARILARRLSNLTDDFVELRERVDASEEDETVGNLTTALNRLVDRPWDREY